MHTTYFEVIYFAQILKKTLRITGLEQKTLGKGSIKNRTLQLTNSN